MDTWNVLFRKSVVRFFYFVLLKVFLSVFNFIEVFTFLVKYFAFAVQELCTMHRLEAGDMVTEWVAFTHSKKNIVMCIDMLEQFEREVESRFLILFVVSIDFFAV